MVEMTTKQIRDMGSAQIAGILRLAAAYEREHTVITFDHGTLLVNVCAIHGDRLADGLGRVVDGNKIAAIAALLMASVNAPEGEIWCVATEIAQMVEQSSHPLDITEDGDAGILIKALKAYRAETVEEENAIGYYVQQIQKVAADKADAA